MIKIMENAFEFDRVMQSIIPKSIYVNENIQEECIWMVLSLLSLFIRHFTAKTGSQEISAMPQKYSHFIP